MVAVTIYSDFGAQENKVCHSFHCCPIYLPWNDGTRYHDLHFLNVEFQATFFTLLLHFHQDLFSSCMPSIREMSSAYLRLLILLLAILIPVCASHMMYSAYKLNTKMIIYSIDVLMYWCIPNFEPFLFSMSDFNCYFLTCIQIFQRQVRWSGIPISFRISHSLLWSTQSVALA